MKLSEIISEIVKEGAPVFPSAQELQKKTAGAKVDIAANIAADKTKDAGGEVQKMAIDIAKERAANPTVKPPTPPLEPITPPDLSGGQGSKEQAEKQKEAMGVVGQKEQEIELAQGKEDAVKMAAEKFSNILNDTNPAMKNPDTMQKSFDELVTAITDKEEKSKEDIDMLGSLEKMSRIGMEKLATLTAGNTQDIVNNLQKVMSLGK